MSTDDTTADEESNDDETLLAGAIRGVLDASGRDALRLETIADAVGASPDQIRETLAELNAADDVVETTLPDGSTGWAATTDTVEGYETANSYAVSDRATGLVTRADSRPGAYRRLADRLEQFDRGDHVGAQVLGIAERVMSPAYVESYEELLEGYVRPDDRHLYVYVEGDGVREVETATELNRSQSVLGFSLTGVYDRAAFAAESVVPLDRLLAETRIEPHHFPLGVFKLSAVHPEYQRRGIGRALGTHGMAYLAQHPPVVTMLWDRSDNRGNVELTEEYPGSEYLATFDGATPLDDRCPVCGFDTECRCGTIVYGWGFDVAD
jgi:ribosomal protein S18 acetylase RimI-like enzyme